MTNPRPAVAGALLLALALHWRRLLPFRGALLIASPGGRFALPAAGRFDLALAEPARIGGFWIELSFGDRPGSHFLILRDQLAEADWRQLRLILREPF